MPPDTRLSSTTATALASPAARTRSGLTGNTHRGSTTRTEIPCASSFSATMIDVAAITPTPTISRSTAPCPAPCRTPRRPTLDGLHETGHGAVALRIVGVGVMAATSIIVAEKLEAQGISVRVVDPRWVLPVSPDLVRAAGDASAVAVVEDNLVSGGIGSSVTLAMRQAGSRTTVCCYGIPKEFLAHGSRSQVLDEIGLTPDAIATSLAKELRRSV